MGETTNLIHPFVETGSVKNVFKKYVYQPNVKMYTGEHFLIHKDGKIRKPRHWRKTHLRSQ